MSKIRKTSKSDKSSSDSSSSLSSSCEDDAKVRDKLKKIKKKIKKEERKAEKRLKRKLKKEKKKLKKAKKSKEKERSRSVVPEYSKEPVKEKTSNVPIGLMERSKAMAPMTKEEWEKRQAVVRKVLDEESGRYRLIKGDGEVLEEIVPQKRHKEINKQATQADGAFYQSVLSKGTQ